MSSRIPLELLPKNEAEKLFVKRIMQFIANEVPHRNSERMTPYKRLWGKHLIGMGFRQHDIAAAMRVNQGRLSEAKHDPAQFELDLKNNK